MTRTVETYKNELAQGLNDIQADLANRAIGYISDSVSELADEYIGIYYAEQDEFAEKHPDYLSRAVCEGIALEMGEYCKTNPNADFTGYMRHCAVAGWYLYNYDEMYGYESGDTFDTAVLHAVLDMFTGREVITDSMLSDLEVLSLGDCCTFDDAYDIVAEILNRDDDGDVLDTGALDALASAYYGETDVIFKQYPFDDVWRCLRYDDEHDVYVDAFGAEPMRNGWITDSDVWCAVRVAS